MKPEFWTDEKVVELSPFARLLFIGLWNFCDDDGRMGYSPKRIKMQIFPADNLDISELFGELQKMSLVSIYTIDGIEYLQINNFCKHQKVDKRTASKLPAPPNSAESHPPLGGNCLGMEGIKEGNGRDQGNASGASAPSLLSEDRVVAEKIWQDIKALHPSHKPPDLNKWTDTVRLMRERDKRTHKEISELWAWAHAHDFWSQNILSPDKLRKQWDKLVIQKNASGKKNALTYGPSKPPKEFPR